MLNIALIDPIPQKDHRISKDTSGGYGTANDFGDTLVAKMLKKALKYSHDWPPLFAAYTMAVLKKKNFNIKYHRNLDFDFQKTDIVIVISSIVGCESEIEYIKKIKEKNNNIKVFAIGPFATNNPKLYCDNKAIVVSGEPEFFFLKNENFLDYSDGEIIKFEHNFELDDLPFPLWNEMLTEKYKASLLFGNYKTVPIIATRGCPYSCFKYCVYPLQQGRVVRQRNPQKIVDEFEHWKKNFGIKMFIFRDPVFSINRKHTIELCNEIIARNLNITWKIVAGTKVESIKKTSTIELMAKSGCKYISISPESGSMKIMKEIGKPFDINHAYKIVKSMNENKIYSQACFVLGYPGEDKNDLNLTKKMILNFTKNGIDEIAIFIISPIPGSEIFNLIDGYSNFSELNFSPTWRSDYSYLFKKRIQFYLFFLLLKIIFFPTKIIKQIWNFFTLNFQTKMEMVPYKYLKLSILTLRS